MLSVYPQSKTPESKTQAIWFDLRDGSIAMFAINA
jgi:hypothetical protein